MVESDLYGWKWRWYLQIERFYDLFRHGRVGRI